MISAQQVDKIGPRTEKYPTASAHHQHGKRASGMPSAPLENSGSLAVVDLERWWI
jgi:hypothetical protein